MKKILIIGKLWPEPASSAAGARMMQLIRFFSEESFELHFATSSKETGFNSSLNEFGVKCESIKLNCPSFDEYILQIDPDIVLFDRFLSEEQFGWRVIENCPNALRILDTEDLHFLREARQKALKSGADLDETQIRSDMLMRELASIHRCDLNLIVSETEIELLTTYYAISKRKLLFLPVTAPDKVVNSLPRNQRKGFVFIGNFWHEPNWDAVLYLKKDIWPHIRKSIPGAVINIYGAYPSEKVYNLNNEKEGFIVHGRAENAQTVVGKALVSLVPLRFGAGMKGKILESWSCDTPCVSTKVGAEDMTLNGIFGGKIADNTLGFISAAINMYQNQAEWDIAVDNGRKINENRYSYKLNYDRLKLRLEELKESFKELRKQDIFSQMLQHHTLLSTKYFSKWIQEKNKNK